MHKAMILVWKSHPILNIRDHATICILGAPNITSFVSEHTNILHDIVQCVLADFCKWTEPFLNQAPAGRRPAHAWFLKIDPVQIVGMCANVSAPEAINN